MEFKKSVGLDIGSQTIKAVILDDTKILSSATVFTGDDAEVSAKKALEQALQKTGGNKKAAADMLRLKRTTLSAKVRSLAFG